MTAQRFGGSHTRTKLDIVEKYLLAYVKVMKNQDFRLYYVDAFAGSGSSSPKERTSVQTRLDLMDADDVVVGSAARALGVEPPFDDYLFVEKRQENAKSLTKLMGNYPSRNATVRQGDANVELIKFAEMLATERMSRAVVFLDPFGLSVNWTTIAALASTEKVDLWYLVPAHGMNRQVKNNGDLLPGARKIDQVLGTTNWKARFVQEDDVIMAVPPALDLLGQPIATRGKIGGASDFSDIMRALLESEFRGGVSQIAKPLGRNGRHEHSLVFACANSRPAAYSKALAIADHILKA